MLPGPPRRLSGVQPATSVLIWPGVWTHTGPFGLGTLGPVALWTRELRKDPPVVNVPAVRP